MRDSGIPYKRGLKQTIDWKLIICYVLLVFIGWMSIYASIHSSEPESIFDLTSRSGKQLIWIVTSFGLASLILFVFNARLWEVISFPSYILVVLLLVLVIFVSNDVNGSHSWFELGPVKFQPAEISKITTSLVLAMLMSRPTFKISKPREFLRICIVLAVPMLAILGESETGSALVYVGFLFVLYREGLSGWLLTVIGLAIVLFILTLTASPYVSLLVLTGTVSLGYSSVKSRIREWFKADALVIAFFALLPAFWRLLCEAVIPHSGIILNGCTDPSVTDAIIQGSKWAFLLKIKPIHIFLCTAGLALPVFCFRAFRDKHLYLWAAILAFLVGVILVFSTSFIFDNLLQNHQRARIEVLLGLKEDPSGVGYNVNQSMIAIGSGGLFGKGYLHGTQTTYGFVPEQSTDFIFCTIGEEWGFVGCLIVILLYVFMIIRIISDAERSREDFTRIYGYCVASCIFMHLFINIGMTIGLMPVIGIPLPLLSYGGSSLWAFTILLFIFIALNREEKKYF